MRAPESSGRGPVNSGVRDPAASLAARAFPSTVPHLGGLHDHRQDPSGLPPAQACGRRRKRFFTESKRTPRIRFTPLFVCL